MIRSITLVGAEHSFKALIVFVLEKIEKNLIFRHASAGLCISASVWIKNAIDPTKMIRNIILVGVEHSFKALNVFFLEKIEKSLIFKICK